MMRKNIPKKVRYDTWDYYVGRNARWTRCFCCHRDIIKIDDFHCGHIVADVDGGEATIKNLRPVCHRCNLSMSRTNMIEYMRKHSYGKLPDKGWFFWLRYNLRNCYLGCL